MERWFCGSVFLVPSVPASHRDHDAALWGHPHLASLLREHAVVEDSTDGQIVVQVKVSFADEPSHFGLIEDWLGYVKVR